MPPPEGEDDEGGGLIRVVAMYDFTAKEDTDLTLRQVLTEPGRTNHSEPRQLQGLNQVFVSAGGRVRHPSQTGPAVVESAGQTRVTNKFELSANLESV